VAEVCGALCGYAVFFRTYSTFLCKAGIWLEDLYVRPDARGRGIGKALLQAVREIAAERGCGRYEWSVLDWNRRAIDFYEALGGRILDDWRIVRMEGKQIETFARTLGTKTVHLETTPREDAEPPTLRRPE
jgi:hypothetical protein